MADRSRTPEPDPPVPDPTRPPGGDAGLIDPDDLPDGLVVIDERAVITAVNRTAETLLQRERDALVGVDVREALPLQDTSGRRWWDATDPWSGLETRTGHRERLLLLPGGSELLVTARYLRAERGGSVERVVVQLRGTEARQRAESDAASLIATVAHELRSPLTSVKRYTSALLRRWDRFSDEQKRLMLTTVEADADRVTRLITELLDVSRVDTGRLRVHLQPVDVVAAVANHVERLVTAGYDDDRFAVTAAADLPEVWADPDRLDQVLANLIENAVRHGAGCVRLDVRPQPAAAGEAGEGWLVLTVDDEGEGISEENRPYVFSKFWRGGGRGGTGLGLYVVRGLVEAHSGRVEVDRSPAGGARFRVLLPAGEPPQRGSAR
ncbi:PAS domain-containing protein [Kineococcus xinjiangensis]|uniref:histidine kinase n=1 Tax=Kineococcus xinjiangensis TaxID=512762 RepID=A0A2S6ILT2_9ACTN|nr:ATP-binding protein [Kineococcus xinjiangensis]PPK95193.1 PAS domain-containing protein [Kineococcus xinjiangensis]